MKNKKLLNDISLLVRRLLAKNIELKLETRELWLLTCAKLLLENPQTYSCKENIQICYEHRPSGPGKYFSFCAQFDSDQVHVNVFEYYSDHQGVYNQSKYKFPLDDSSDERSEEQKLRDEERLKSILGEVNDFIEKDIKPTISSQLQEIKMTKDSKIRMKLEQLSNSMEFENGYGSKSRALKIKKKIHILTEKIRQTKT